MMFFFWFPTEFVLQVMFLFLPPDSSESQEHPAYTPRLSSEVKQPDMAAAGRNRGKPVAAQISEMRKTLRVKHFRMRFTRGLELPKQAKFTEPRHPNTS